MILTPSGEEYDATKYPFKPNEDDLKALVEKEVLKRELEGGRELGTLITAVNSALSGSP